MTGHHGFLHNPRDVHRPARGTGWKQWRRERRCRKNTGHCWHAELLIAWWCCMCSAETEGMPADNCRPCGAGGIQARRWHR